MLAVTHKWRRQSHTVRSRPSPLAARDFPGGSPVALGIHQLILFPPAQHKAQREGKEQTQPETAREAAIKDMQDLSSKLRRELEKQFALLIAFERREGTTTGPPTHRSQGGGIELLLTPHQDHRQEVAAPAQKWDRAAGCSSLS
jgi:hypothetical protein